MDKDVSILIKCEKLECLKKTGHKGQTYDQAITELIQLDDIRKGSLE